MSAIVETGGKEYLVSEEKLSKIADEILEWLENHENAPVEEFEDFINKIITEDTPWPLLLSPKAANALTIKSIHTFVIETVAGLATVYMSVKEPFSREYVEKIERIEKLIKDRYITG